MSRLACDCFLQHSMAETDVERQLLLKTECIHFLLLDCSLGTKLDAILKPISHRRPMCRQLSPWTSVSCEDVRQPSWNLHKPMCTRCKVELGGRTAIESDQCIGLRDNSFLLLFFNSLYLGLFVTQHRQLM